LYTVKQYGAFASLHVEFNDGWAATLGGRVSTNTYKFRSAQTQLDPFLQQQSQLGYGSSGVITPFAALLYKIDDHYSWYTSYADIYRGQPANSQRANGTNIGPQEGVTLETGMKGVWRDGALNGSVAIYRTTQSNERFIDNTVTPRFITDLSSVRFYTGAIRSRGADVQLDGELRPGWLIGGGYTYNFSRDGNGSLLFTATPLHLLKVWTSFRLPGDLARWTVGGSVRAQTPASYGIYIDCTGVSGNCPDVQLDQKPFAVLDSRVEFEIDPHWRVALNVNNVLDKTYYETVDISNRAWYGEPRNFMLRVEAKY
jgi:outer-membrane receptor for ferric coprogen and ferric-rhodotorulic acid